MTPLEKPVRRLTRGALDGSHGCDKGRRLVAEMQVGDLISIRPHGTRRAEVISIFDVYRFAIRCRTQKVTLEKARAKKEKIAVRKLAAKIRREDAKLRRPL